MRTPLYLFLSVLDEEASILVPTTTTNEEATLPILETTTDEEATLHVPKTTTNEEDAPSLGSSKLLSVDLKTNELISVTTMDLMLGNGSAHDVYCMSHLEKPYKGTFDKL